MSNSISTSDKWSLPEAISLSHEDREKLLFEFTQWEYNKEETLGSLFQKQANIHAENIAVVYKD